MYVTLGRRQGVGSFISSITDKAIFILSNKW